MRFVRCYGLNHRMTAKKNLGIMILSTGEFMKVLFGMSLAFGCLFSEIAHCEQQTQWKIVQEINFDWNKDGHADLISLAIPDVWNDPGEFTRLTVAIKGKPAVDFKVEGIHIHGFYNESLVNSEYVALIASETADKPLLVLKQYAYASAPGKFTIIALKKDSVPEIVFDKMFTPQSLYSYKDKTTFTGMQDSTECHGMYHCSYNPQLVYRLSRTDKGALKFEIDLTESEKLNKTNNYPWAGPDYLKDKLVFTPPRTLVDKKSVLKR